MLKDGKHYDKIVLAKFSSAAALSDDKTDGQTYDHKTQAIINRNCPFIKVMFAS